MAQFNIFHTLTVMIGLTFSLFNLTRFQFLRLMIFNMHLSIFVTLLFDGFLRPKN